jgi:stage IV sporulation protein FB
MQSKVPFFMLKIPGKIPVFIHPFFWVLAFLIGWLNTSTLSGVILWTGIIIVSVLVHELGHALTAVAFGQQARIELMAMGGMTYRKGKQPLGAWKEFLIVLNGPLAGFCLAGIAWICMESLRTTYPESLWTYVAEATFYVNVFWTILNLLPVHPLDGGKLLSIVLGGIFGIRGTKIALFISFFLAGALTILFLVFREFFIGSFFALFTFESYKSWKESLALSSADENEELQLAMKEAEAAMQQGNKTLALQKLLHVRETAKKGKAYLLSTEYAAYLLAQMDNPQRAHDMLSSLGKTISPKGFCLLHQLAFNQKNWEEVAALGDKVYQLDRSDQVAVANAIAHAALGNVKQTIGWMQCATQEGLPNVNSILEKSEFNRIRNDPEFRQFIEQI